ncbi:putative spermidine/putrescine transport system substrate-binding protein [Pseudonocardia thermophila]|jgi:Spermidine/putrescine-binding periplasmic protein|uniref:Putative spermidine/putrescine transport system substrate-binding protein n=1 Tax=Pseudonocardia thermophila TaxID=1848 RepID=A0A1M6ZMI7_PSETH|nr:extracellular solute-binding protein [Pseudonocardia thermophila]SHL31682.1 putative spermidine/putrescine transport system substrate-binding protein [Pseudonocardia thermophila]
MRPTKLVSAAVVGVVLATTAACGSGSGADPSAPAGPDTVITWQTTGGEATENEKKAFQEPFTAKTGATFDNVTSLNYISQLHTMVEQGQTVWDVVHTGSYLAKQHCGTLFETVDLSRFPVDKVPEGTVTDCSVPATKYATDFAYDASVYTGDVPTSIKDFFDVARFPGKRVVYGGSPKGILEAALVADGVPPDQLYPLDVERALAKLGTIKSEIIFAPSFTALQQNLVNKQATMTLTLSGRLAIIRDSGADLTPVWDFTSWDYDAFVVPKGAPNAAAAKEAIAFALEPEQLRTFAELSGLTPVRDDIDLSTVEFTESGKLFNPFLEGDHGTVVLQDPDWWAKNQAAAAEKWTAWQVG